MRKKLLSLMLVGALSISMLYGCSDTDKIESTTPSQNQSQDDSKTDTSKENANEDVNDNKDETSSEDTPTSGNTDPNAEINGDENNNINDGSKEDINVKVKDKFTEAISTIYNSDFTSDNSIKTVTDYINDNFADESKEDMLNTIKSYTTKISSSDLVITLVREVETIDASKYDATFDVRYNVTITEDKPFVYSDLIGKVVIDKSGKVLIKQINEGNF